MSSSKATIKPYQHPAAGWGALKQVAAQLALQKIPVKGVMTLLAQNQPDGFDCPGCAWPDKEHTSTFEFCENGVKAVAAEATAKRVPPAFFAQHTVTELMTWSDFDLENEGRLTHPMRYNATTDKYEAVSWEEAFAVLASHLQALDDPNEAVFYTSGRASNEAAFLYQLFVRVFGTNNFPDCSNLCHESTSIALPATVGIGKGSVTLADFEHADTLLIFGQNPATNHPRMLGELREAAKRGARIVAINPLRERGLERFADPQSPFDMLSFKGSKISSLFIQPTLGGDLALIKGMIKFMIQWDDEALAHGRERVVDVDFITTHTLHFEAIAEDARQESWAVIERESGVPIAQIEEIARIYATGDRVIATWGMGITQHKYGVATIKTLVNLMLLRGNIGKPGAGLCPVRGHSNVQGNRTVGIYEKMPLAFLEQLENVFQTPIPKTPGYDSVGAIEAMIAGKVKFFFGLGGNFAISTPDTDRTWAGMRRCALTAHVTTKLNRSHLVHGQEAFILPCLGRTEIDTQASGPQGVTVEDSMSMVHISYGMNKPASPHLLSEPAIVARLAHATLPHSTIPWLDLITDYRKIRDLIERTLPEAFKDYNARIQQPGGFRMPVPSSERIWLTASGKAEFSVQAIPTTSPIHQARAKHGDQLFVLMTTRSHDQYNTTIYGMDDRYRGVFGERRVIFMHPNDIARMQLQAGDWINLISVWEDGITRRADRFMVVAYDIPEGCLSAYYPETNNLVPLSSVGDQSRTPTSKSIPVRIEKWSAEAFANVA